MEALDLAVEQEKGFVQHMTLKQKEVLARRRQLIDELDLFDRSHAAAHSTHTARLFLLTSI